MSIRNFITIALCICILSSNFIPSIHAQASTSTPTNQPTTSDPTAFPTKKPTDIPTSTPIKSPTDIPTRTPSKSPTDVPTKYPTDTPTKSPSAFPTAPSTPPTAAPSGSPSTPPTAAPTTPPTIAPSQSPTDSPTDEPTTAPTFSPTFSPTKAPTSFPTFKPESCVSERTSWKDWNYVISEEYLSRYVDENDAFVILKILPSNPTTKSFIFTYHTQMVFTANSSTWLELEFQCGGTYCRDNSWGSRTNTAYIYIYDEDFNYIAVTMGNNYFKLSRPSGSSGQTCSPVSTMTLSQNGADIVNGTATTSWSQQFGYGLDRWNSRGKLEDGKVLIRFLNDDITKRSYVNIRVKYGSDSEETSYLCAIDGAFTPNSNISFALQGRTNDDPYIIQHIDIKTCSGYWDIPRVWCETNEAFTEQYASWNNEAKYELIPAVYIHGLFNKMHVLQQTFAPLIPHEAVTIEFDLYYTVNNATVFGSYFNAMMDDQIFYIEAPEYGCDGDWMNASVSNYCTKHILLTETTSRSSIEMKIWFQNPSVLYNHTISWGFTNLCINQTYKITYEPTPTPTDAPVMPWTECNNYKTRLSDWDTIYNVSITSFIPHGIAYIEFSSIGAVSTMQQSDWLLSIDTNLYFPPFSSVSTWLNIEMHGFRSITNVIESVQPIVALSDGTQFTAVHFTPNGLEFYPECDQPLILQTNQSLNEIYNDPLKDWAFVRTDDYWISESGWDPPVYDPGDIILKYLSDPVNNATYLYVDRRFRSYSSYLKNLTWICKWEGIYTDDLTYFLGQTVGDPDYLIEDIEFDECSAYWDVPPHYCDDITADINKWTVPDISTVESITPFLIHGVYSSNQTVHRTVSTVFYHERVIITGNIFTFGYVTADLDIVIRINDNNIWNVSASVGSLCASNWTTVNFTPSPEQPSPLCSIPVYIEYIEFSKDPIMMDIGPECPQYPDSNCFFYPTEMFGWGFNSFCMETEHQLTHDPTPAPTAEPTAAPSTAPSLAPTTTPTLSPTDAPTTTPTTPPTAAPSGSPTQPPSKAPTTPPTAAPSGSPTQPPSKAPTTPPTVAPSLAPSYSPTDAPSDAPTLAPTDAPSNAPSLAPSVAPTDAPSLAPSDSPSLAPSGSPTQPPSDAPTLAPTGAPHSTITLPPSASPTEDVSVTPAPTVEDVPDTGTVPVLTHPPFIVSAYFNSEGTTITIIFDTETNMPAHTTGYSTCHYVLSLSDDSILGQNTDCVWKSRTVFVITIDTATSSIMPDDTLRTKIYVIDRWGIFDEGYEDYFKVFGPLIPTDIVAEISGPIVVGQCATFTLSSVSSGVKNSSTSKWELISPQPSGMETVSYGNILSLDANSFGVYLGDIEISLSVTNWLGTEDTTTHTVQRALIDAPIISIAGKTVQILDTSNEFTIISDAYLASCSGSTLWNIGIKWIQITDETQIINYGIDTSALIASVTYTDILTFDYDSSSSLSIPAFGLKDDNSYLFYVYASNGGDFDNTNITSCAYVTVTAFDIPTAKTVNQQTIGTNAFTLYYTDFFEFPRGIAPDNDHYTYTWECEYTELPENITLSSSDKNYINDFGYIWTPCSFTDASLVTNNGQFPMSDTTPFELYFGEYALVPNSVYIITLQISDNNNYFANQTSSISLFTKPVELPQITITSSIAFINPDEHAVISVDVTPNDAIIVWRPTDASSDLLPVNLYALTYIAIKEEINEDSNIMSSNLILNPDFDLNVDATSSCSNDNTASFQNGKEYSFTIWARNIGAPQDIIDYYASTNIIVTINSAPTGGTCAVTPTNGTAVETRFEFFCQNWNDPDGASEALTYNFMYNNVFLGEDFSSSSYLASVIGGTDGDMIAYIKDEDGLNTCFDIAFTVTERFDDVDEQEIVNTIDSDMESIQAYLLSQSIANTLQNALAVSEMIRELSRKMQGSNFTKTLNQYKNSLMEYVIQSQDNSAQSINSALQHIQTVDAMLNEDPLDSEESLLIDFGTADEILIWIENILSNYQTSTSDSDILLPPMLSLLEKIQDKALNDHISANDTMIDVEDDTTNYILDAAVDITMSTFTYGLQNRVLGEQITHDTPILNGQAMMTRPNPFSFTCPTSRFGATFIDISFPTLFYEGMQHQSSVTCGIIRMASDYYGFDQYISTDIFEIDVLSIDINGEVVPANSFVSTAFTRRRRNRRRRRMQATDSPLAQDTDITDNYTLDACNAIIFAMDLSGDARDVFFEDIDPVANKTIYVPTCKFYDPFTESWNTEGCITLNYTQDTVWCSCQHFTSFAGIAAAFRPQVNIITNKDLRNLTASNVFLLYPTAFCTLCVLHFITMMLLCFLPKQDDTPLLARADVLQNKLRKAQAMERWRLQQFVEVLQSPMGLTKKLLRLFAYRLQDDHSVISLFTRSEGTNYSTSQRVMILHLYLITVMGVSALFYGQTTGSPFGDMILAIYASVLSFIPVFTIRYMFQYSRPKETKEFVEWETKLLAKKLIALKGKKGAKASNITHPKQGSKGKLDLTVADTNIEQDMEQQTQPEPQAQPEPEPQAPPIKVKLTAAPLATEQTENPPKSPATPSLLPTPVGNKGRTPTVGESHVIGNLSFDYVDGGDISDSEEQRLMANIFNLDRPTTTNAPKTSVLHTPNFVMEMDNNQNLHHRVQSVIRRHLSMFVNPEMHKSLLNEVTNDDDNKQEEEEEDDDDNDDKQYNEEEKASNFLATVDLKELFKAEKEEEMGKKYEITVYSAPLGIILESDNHGYNTQATDITSQKALMYESAGIEVGMILSHLNDINVLGLPFNIVKKKLMECTYPIKLCFMSEKTVLIRFDWVLSAASFIHHSLNIGYDKSDFVKFLAHEGMSKLEVRCAVHLKNEHPQLLPRVKQQTESYLRNEMNGNTMFSLFLDSEWAQKKDNNNNEETLYTPPIGGHKPGIATQLFEKAPDHNVDSSMEEAMGDMLNMFGLDTMDPYSTPHVQKGGTMERISKRVSNLLPSKNKEEHLRTEEEPMIGDHAPSGTMIINADDIKLDEEDFYSDDETNRRSLKYGNTLTLNGNQTVPVPRHSKLVTTSDSAHIFLSQLQLIKLNSSRPDMNIPSNCYDAKHFTKALREESGAQFTESEMDDMMHEMMDVNTSIEYNMTLLSDSSFNEFINSGGKSSAARRFLDLIMDSKHSKPSVPSMNAPMMNIPIVSAEELKEEEDIVNDKMMDELYVTVIADILIKRLKDKKYKEFRRNLPTKQRRKLLKYYYPLPSFTKTIGWLFLILFYLCGCFVILNYGLKFDILFYANVAIEDDIYLQSECPGNLTDISINELIQYSIDKQAVDEYVQPNINDGGVGSFGEEVTDSRRFVLVIALSVIQSLVIWQPVIILFFCILIIVNYVAGKSADMSLKDYAIAVVHILFCQFCRDYRSYTREQETMAAADDDKELSTIKEEEEQKETHDETQNNASVELAPVITEETVLPSMVQVDSKSQTADKRSSLSSNVNTKTGIPSATSTPITSENTEAARTRSQSRSRTESIRAMEPASYRFIRGFDTIYNENKFETLANQLAGDEFDWKSFGMDQENKDGDDNNNDDVDIDNDATKKEEN